jgi:hypothetical protein
VNEEEKNEEEEPQPGPADQPPIMGRHEIEQGLFGLVITLCRMHEGEGATSEQARERTASFLDRLINGLRTRPEQQEGEQIR